MAKYPHTPKIHDLGTWELTGLDYNDQYKLCRIINEIVAELNEIKDYLQTIDAGGFNG